MKVQVFNSELKSIEVIQRVVKIRNCPDGRILVTAEKKCECCEHVSNFTSQVPANYTIQILLDELDDIHTVY